MFLLVHFDILSQMHTLLTKPYLWTRLLYFGSTVVPQNCSLTLPKCHFFETREVIRAEVSVKDTKLISALQVLLYLTGSLREYRRYHRMVANRIYRKGAKLPTKAAVFLYVNHRAKDHERKFFQIKEFQNQRSPTGCRLFISFSSSFFF